MTRSMTQELAATESKGKALLALAERCEAATGPARRFDAAIVALTRLQAVSSWAVTWPGEWHAGEDGVVTMMHADGSKGPWFKANPYTASFDAAMSLVPEGWRPYTADFSIPHHFTWMLEGPKLTRIEHADGTWEGGDDWYASGFGKSAALSLCAAALRARALDAPDRTE